MSTNSIINYAKKNGGSISAKEYNRLLKEGVKLDFNKTTKESTSKGTKADKYSFSFKLIVEKINDVTYKFTIEGRHYSTNDVNGWLSFGKRNAYKNAIKESFNNYFMINRKDAPKKPFKKAIMYSIAYNPSSRDDDGNRITLKPFRDMLTEYKFILDDKREFFFEFPNFERKSKIYKMEIILIEVENLPTFEDFSNKWFLNN